MFKKEQSHQVSVANAGRRVLQMNVRWEGYTGHGSPMLELWIYSEGDEEPFPGSEQRYVAI